MVFFVFILLVSSVSLGVILFVLFVVLDMVWLRFMCLSNVYLSCLIYLGGVLMVFLFFSTLSGEVGSKSGFLVFVVLLFFFSVFFYVSGCFSGFGFSVFSIFSLIFVFCIVLGFFFFVLVFFGSKKSSIRKL